MGSQQQHTITFIADDGTELHGAEATAAMAAVVDDQQELRERLARERPKQWARYVKAKEEAGRRFEQDPRRQQKVAEFWEARRRGEAASLDLSAEWTRAHSIPRSQGHAPQQATNHHSGRPRRGDRSSSSSSDDPGGDGSDPEPQRTCECGCGESIDHLRSDARFLDGTHRMRALRRSGAEQDELTLRPIAVAAIHRPCSACPHPAMWPDEDGDPVCLACGQLVGKPSPPNGHEEYFGHMVTDNDGEPRRVYRRRHIPFTPRRPRRRRPVRTYFLHENDRGGRPEEVNPAPPAANS